MPMHATGRAPAGTPLEPCPGKKDTLSRSAHPDPLVGKSGTDAITLGAQRKSCNHASERTSIDAVGHCEGRNLEPPCIHPALAYRSASPSPPLPQPTPCRVGPLARNRRSGQQRSHGPEVPRAGVGPDSRSGAARHLDRGPFAPARLEPSSRSAPVRQYESFGSPPSELSVRVCESKPIARNGTRNISKIR